MMKKRYQALATVLISSQLLGAISPVFADATPAVDGIASTPHRFIPEEAYSDTYRDDYRDYLRKGEYSEGLRSELEELKERSEDIKSNEELNSLINDFASLHEHLYRKDAGRFHADNELLGYNLSLEVFEAIRDAIYEEGNATRVIRFANQLSLGINEGATGFSRLIFNLVETNPIEDAQESLDDVGVIVRHARANITEGIEPTLEIVAGKLTTGEDEDALRVEMEKDELLNPGEGMDIDDPGEWDTTPDDSVLDSAEIIDYDADYVPKDINSASVSLPAREGTYYEFNADAGQRIRVDYVITVEKGEENRSETRTVEAEGLTSMWSDRLSQHISGTINQTTPTWTETEEEDVEEESTLTLQYTLNKDDAFPVYVDTGLFAETDGSASYEDVYEVLYQIAVNTDNGYLVEDSDKLLTIVESRPVYIQEQDDLFSQDEIESLFESFDDVELIVAETRIGTTDSLEWQLRTGQEQEVRIDGETVDFYTMPDVRNDRVVLPIVEMMEAVGGVVEMDDSILTARYDGQEVRFEAGVQEARVDGELIDLHAPVERNEHGVYTANLMPVFRAVGIEAVWDEQESALVLDGTLREAMLEAEAELEEDESDGEYTPGVELDEEDSQDSE